MGAEINGLRERDGNMGTILELIIAGITIYVVLVGGGMLCMWIASNLFELLGLAGLILAVVIIYLIFKKK